MSGKHKHHHEHHTTELLTSNNVTIVFVLNVFFAILEFIFGVLFNSAAVLSDAVHDTGDAVAIGLAWFFQKYSKKKEDANYTLGYKRFSLLGATITSLILVVGSIMVMVTSIPRIFFPEAVHTTGIIGLAIFAILMNGFGGWLLSKGTSRTESILNLHMLEDVLGWIGVLLVGIVMRFQQWYWLDPLLSVAIAVLILTKAVPKFIGTLHIFLEKTPENVEYNHLLNELEGLKEVRALTQLLIWSIDGESNAAMLHLILEESTDISRAKEEVRKVLETHHVGYSAIEIDESVDEHACHLTYKG